MSDSFASIVCHSISEQDIPLVTVHLHYWRGIHSEVMTHRVFSRNARSSRAVPVSRMIDEVQYDPFIPKHWGKNQKGMQAGEECNEPVGVDKPKAVLLDTEPELHRTIEDMSREGAWLYARDQAIRAALGFKHAGYHKQIVNRLLEPFMWIDTLVSSTDWANFMALRDHKDAEPHIRDLAQQVKEALGKSTPTLLKPGQWHLPYITENDLRVLAWSDLYLETRYGIGHPTEAARRISAARCARISYAPFDGNDSIEAELERFEKLVGTIPVHASPVEHQATPDRLVEEALGSSWATPWEHRNFRGWRQYRAIIPFETIRD